MKYFKAIPVPDNQPPYVRWAEWAPSLEKIIEMGLENDPMILPEELVPDFTFGICPIKILDGELVNRDESEIAEAEAVFNQRITVSAESQKVRAINNGKFAFGGNEFPLHEAARARYLSVALDTPHVDTYMMTFTGDIVTIAAADIAAFISQFHKGIKLITNVVPSDE